MPTAKKSARKNAASKKRSAKKAVPKKQRGGFKTEPVPPAKGASYAKNVIDKVKITQGRLVRVWNQDAKPAANPKYVAVWVEAASGKKERCLLFTESQIAAAEDRANKNKEDLTKKTWWTDLGD